MIAGLGGVGPRWEFVRRREVIDPRSLYGEVVRGQVW